MLMAMATAIWYCVSQYGIGNSKGNGNGNVLIAGHSNGNDKGNQW